jgi:hypothetical protein
MLGDVLCGVAGAVGAGVVGTHGPQACFLVVGFAVSVVAAAPQVVFAGELAGGKCADRGVGAEPADLLLHGDQFGTAGADGPLESFEVGVGVVGVAE